MTVGENSRIIEAANPILSLRASYTELKNTFIRSVKDFRTPFLNHAKSDIEKIDMNLK